MSRFGMGFGKDHPKLFENGRPALTNQGTRRQRVMNDWFEDGPEQRPEWLLSKYKESKHEIAAEKGDWKLVWRPKSRMMSPTRPTRKILMTLKDDEERERLKAQLQEELQRHNESSDISFDTASNRQGDAGSKSGTLPAIKSGPDRHMLGTAGTGCSSRTTTSHIKYLQAKQTDKISNAGEVMDLDAGTVRRTPATRSTSRSKSVMSQSSLSTIQNRDELLDRIKGLEDALLAEKQMREKMQLILKQESDALMGGESRV